MLYGEENHGYKKMTRRVAGKKIKGRGGESKATQEYTPLDLSYAKICERSFKCDLAGHSGRSSFIRLEMAEERIKTLPNSSSRSN